MIKCSKFAYQGAHRIRNLVGKVFEIQGYIIHHAAFGREVRILQMSQVTSLDGEIQLWSEALKLRREVLSKHWNHGQQQSSSSSSSSFTADYNVLSTNPEFAVSMSTRGDDTGCSSGSGSRKQVIENEMAWRLGSLAPINDAPLLFCSFDRKNSTLAVSGSIIETENGVTPSQAHYQTVNVTTGAPRLNNCNNKNNTCTCLPDTKEKRQLLKPPPELIEFNESNKLNDSNDLNDPKEPSKRNQINQKIMETSSFTYNSSFMSYPGYQSSGSHQNRFTSSASPPQKPFPGSITNLNTVFYGDSYRELSPCLTHKIPRNYGQPLRTLRK